MNGISTPHSFAFAIKVSQLPHHSPSFLSEFHSTLSCCTYMPTCTPNASTKYRIFDQFRPSQILCNTLDPVPDRVLSDIWKSF